MSRLTLIQNKLQQVNAARFQQICEAYLSFEFDGVIQTPGTVEGKEKTRKGRPDAYMIQSNGNYLLGEFTTRDPNPTSSFYKKLESDLKDCLDFESIGLREDQINSIIQICNSTVPPDVNENLKRIASKVNVPYRIIGITELGLFLYTKGRILAKDLLEVPFDTGQILSKSQFLSNQKHSSLSPTLDNVLFGRKDELAEIRASLATHNLIIVTGPAGVGKSRLVVEAVDNFQNSHPSFEAFYIVLKSGTITEDLINYIELDKQYILVIDDANRQLHNLISILTANSIRDSQKIKIVITVRDYAKEEVVKHCRSIDHRIILVNRLEDETIYSIISNPPYSISDRSIADKIVYVSKGNPRIACMAASAVVHNSNVSILKDVSSIYDEYFQSIHDERNVLTNPTFLKVLGILSYFQTIDLEDENDLNILSKFDISRESFIETLHQLEEIELVEIYQRLLSKISDQILSTYFFHKTFIRDQIIDFSFLLDNFFQDFYHRMRDNIEPTISVFGEEKVLSRIKTSLITYWQVIGKEEGKANIFLKIFGEYLPTTVFAYILDQIEKTPLLPDPDFKFNDLSSNHFNLELIPALDLLEPHLDSTDEYSISTAIELAVSFVRKKPSNAGVLAKLLLQICTPTSDEKNNGFIKITTIYRALGTQKGADILCKKMFYIVFSKCLLSGYFEKGLFSESTDGFQLDQNLGELRSKFWTEIYNDFNLSKEMVYDILTFYNEGIQQFRNVLLLFDKLFIEELFRSHFNPEIFAECFIVHEYVDSMEKVGIVVSDSFNLREKFNSATFHVFNTLCLRKFRDRDLFSELRGIEEVDQFKQNIITNNLRVGTMTDYNRISASLKEIVECQCSSKFSIRDGLDYFLAGIIRKDTQVGFDILRSYLKEGNLAIIWPRRVTMETFALGNQWHHLLYSLITECKFNDQKSWEHLYFRVLPEDLVTEESIKRILNFYSSLEPEINIYFMPGELDKYLAIQEDIYERVLQILVNSFIQNSKFIYQLGNNFFVQNERLVNRHYELCKEGYIQQFLMHRSYDHDHKDFLILLNYNRDFLLDFIDHMVARSQYLHRSDFRPLINLWNLMDAEDLIYSVLVKLKDVRNFYMSEHFAMIFFVDLPLGNHIRALNVLKRVLEQFPNDLNAINMVFDIARNTLRPSYHHVITYFLTVNSDFEVFKKIHWYNNHFMSAGNESWSDFIAAELGSVSMCIKRLPERMKYLGHIEELEKRIGVQERKSAWERKLLFRGLR